MAKLEWNTLKEAADYLTGETGEQWTERRVLDAALKVYQPRPSGEGKPTLIRAAPPRGTRFSLCRFDMQPATAATIPFIHQHNMPWQTIFILYTFSSYWHAVKPKPALRKIWR